MTNQDPRDRNPFNRAGSAGHSDPYAQLGLEQDATMHEIEAAYWRFAGRLKGQAAMKPYNAAYEALVSRVALKRAEAAEPAQPAGTPSEPVRSAGRDERPLPEEPDAPPVAGSKFNWPPVI